MGEHSVSRRELLAGGAAAGAALALGRPLDARAAWSRALDFRALGDGDGWPGWTCSGVANMRRSGGTGLLQAGSDVFPCDPRPVAFAVDQRFRDGLIVARVRATGAGVGVVLRRVAPREYYAAIYDDEQGALLIVRRSADGVTELARAVAARPSGTVPLALEALGAGPTALRATLGAQTLSAQDATPALQRPGDPGVL